MLNWWVTHDDMMHDLMKYILQIPVARHESL